MGIFSRFRDIVSSNINVMLEKAENPEKLIKLMIQEMEDTLVEIKSSCAGAMASKARVERAAREATERAKAWAKKAQLAINKEREDLAREALLEKRNALEEASLRTEELTHFDALNEQYHSDIRQLEEKLETARNKHRILIQRHIQAQNRIVAQSNIRKANTSDAFVRFDQFENRIERMEADADLINPKKQPTLDDEFAALENDDELERELEALRKQVSKSNQSE